MTSLEGFECGGVDRRVRRVRRCVVLPASDREPLRFSDRSGTRRARPGLGASLASYELRVVFMR